MSENKTIFLSGGTNMVEIDQTKEVLLKDKPFMTLPEAAKYTGVGLHKLSELSYDPNCEFIFWIGKKRMFKREKLIEYLSKAYSI